MDYEVKGVRPRGRRKETWCEFVEKDCRCLAWFVMDKEPLSRLLLFTR